MRGPKTTVGETTSVSLSPDEILSLEIEFGLVLLVELEHHVLHLSSKTVADTRGGHRLEPVAVAVGAVGGGPVKDGGCDYVRRVLRPCGIREKG